MPTLHDTPERTAPGAEAGRRRIWLLPEAAPPESGAAAVLAAWSRAWPVEAPWLLLAPERRAAAWTDALRAAWARAPAAAFPEAEMRRLVRAGAAAGAALIYGGAAADEEAGLRPALFTLAAPTPALRRAWSAPAPLLGIAAREAVPPMDESRLRLETFPA